MSVFPACQAKTFTQASVSPALTQIASTVRPTINSASNACLATLLMLMVHVWLVLKIALPAILLDQDTAMLMDVLLDTLV